MKNTLFTRIFSCLLAGMLGAILINPMGVQAKVVVGLDDGSGSEGDPLDSNDYGTGGSGDGGNDTDIHDSMAAPPDDKFLRVIHTLFVDKHGALILPIFQNGVPTVRFVIFPDTDFSAVTHAD